MKDMNKNKINNFKKSKKYNFKYLFIYCILESNY